MPFNPENIANYRIVNQQLSGTKFKTAQQLVKWFGAVQGQEYAQTKWGLGLRLPHLIDNDIEQELTEGKILRTHLLRPTWHFVSSKDIHWLIDLTAPRVHAANAYMYRKLELDSTLFKRCNDIIQKSLNGNIHLTRDEINTELKTNKIIAEGHRLSYIMMQAELEGLICSGKRNGNQFTYALIEDRVPNKKTLSREESLAELTKRYFFSRGPSTVQDYSTWSGLTLTECRKGIELIGKELENSNGYYYHPLISTNANEEIYLLPIYDEYIMGYKDRSDIIKFKNNNHSKVKLLNDCMIIYAGQIIGSWKRKINKNSINIEYDFLQSLNAKQKNLFNKAIKRFEQFNNLTVNNY